MKNVLIMNVNKTSDTKDFNSQRDAAEWLGIDESTLSRAATGDRGIMSAGEGFGDAYIVVAD